VKTTGEAAADGEGQGRELAAEDRRRSDHDAHHGAGVRAGDEAGQEGAFERQIGRLVVEQQPRRHPGRERDAEREREHEPVGPVPALENQDVAEPVVADEHGRERGHGGQLDDQRRQQNLLSGKELRSRHVPTSGPRTDRPRIYLILSAG
jgi:hypothetical protein